MEDNPPPHLEPDQGEHKMNKEQYELKQKKIMEKAGQVKKETDALVDKSVDEFFAEQQEKRENYVPRKLLPKQIPVGLYRVRWEDDKGDPPPNLSGVYTTIHMAQKAIDSYTIQRDA